MRISVWSSDVCSSDLRIVKVRRAAGEKLDNGANVLSDLLALKALQLAFIAMDAADIRHLRDVAPIEKESEDIDILPLLGPDGSDDEFAKLISHVVPRSFRICAANRASIPCAQATPPSPRSTRNNCADRPPARSEEHTSE